MEHLPKFGNGNIMLIQFILIIFKHRMALQFFEHSTDLSKIPVPMVSTYLLGEKVYLVMLPHQVQVMSITLKMIDT